MKTKTSQSNRGGLQSAITLIMAIAGVTLFSASASAVDRQVLRGHVPATVAKLKLQPVGRLPATNQLRLAIGLPLRHTNELDQLLRELYDPASPRFRHYLTPEQFAERFGPTQGEYEALAQFARSNGFSIEARHPGRTVLDVAGKVEDIEKAFQTTLRTYQHPTERRQFYAPDVEPSVEAGLAAQDVAGLNNYFTPRPLLRQATAPGVEAPPTGSGPENNFWGKDLRNAYAPGVTQTGVGQSVGLVAFEGFYFGDITTYETMTGLPNVPIQFVLLDGFDGIPGPGDSDGVVEASIDVEMAISMAPGLSNVMVFDAGTNGNLTDVLTAMTEHPQTKQFSCSFAGFEQSATMDNLFKKMAANGQTFFCAAGDADSWQHNVCLNFNDYIDWPSCDVYLTSAGGTSLMMKGSGGSYGSEAVWNWGSDPPGWNGSGYSGGGGGVTSLYGRPSWQAGLNISAIGGSTSHRNFPDVAILAENYVAIANGTTSTGWGGTSFASPLWAGFTALVNQAAADNGQPSVGFLNPALYALGEGAGYSNEFHDITVGNNATPVSDGLYNAAPGYDLCTGWGSPTGSNLIYALALPQRLGISPATNGVLVGTVGGPFYPGQLTFTVTNGNGFSPATSQSQTLTWSVGLDADWLSVSPTSGSNGVGAAGTIIDVAPNDLASNLPVGSHEATFYFTNLLDQSVQSRQVSLDVVALPVLTFQPSNATVLEGATAVFSVGTTSNLLLSYQWQFDNGSGATNVTDGDGVSGAATSSLSIANVSPAEAGTYSVVVSNAAGPVASDGASLEVVANQGPEILSGPASQTVLPGVTVALTVSAAGDPPLSYFWQFNGNDITNAGNITGTSSNTLTLSGADAANAGTYSVVITNAFGSATSSPAMLNLTSVTASGVVLTTLYSFNTNTIGCAPVGGLCQAANGVFYGAASEGGVGGVGTVFQMGTNGAVKLLVGFPIGAQNYPQDGSQPCGALIIGTNGDLYGTATGGGSNNNGTVFQVSKTGSAFIPAAFNSASSGAQPYGALIQATNGFLYTTAASDGTDMQDGTIVRYKPGSGTLTVMHVFSEQDGAGPESTLIEGSDGDLYGTTSDGGTNGGWGTIFKMTLGGQLTSLFSFGKTNGSDPIAGLTADGLGNYYGTTYSGGTNGAGTVFKLGVNGVFQSLYSFTGGGDGSNCYGGLVLASDGNLYGATLYGGAYGLGTVFRISTEGALATLASFDGSQGANAYGTLIQAADGNLYGTTEFGGANNWGAIYRISFDAPLQITVQPQPQEAFEGDTAVFSVATSGSLPLSYQWMENGTNLSDGGVISGSSTRTLTLAGVTVTNEATYSVVVSNSYGPATSAGAALTVLVSPPSIISGPAAQTVLAGSTVTLSVSATGDAPLYYFWQFNGTNLTDGGNLSGSATPTLTLVSVTGANAGNYSVLVSNALNTASSPGALLTVLPAIVPNSSSDLYPFASTGGGSLNPYAGVIQGTDGNFYGTTLHGGTGLYGSAFNLSPDGVVTVLHSFTNGVDGGTPFAGLTQASDGNLYGASLKGVGASLGTLFRMTPSGELTPLYAFAGGDDGGNPLASLVQGGDGKLYGTASTGGSNAAGTVFSLSTNGLFTPLWSFNSTNGSFPTGPLVQGSDGNLYGTASAGGANGLGTVFSLSTNGVFNSLASFDDTVGAYPSNGVVQATDGAFYGTASSGGTNGGWGTVFRIATNGALTALHSFNYQDGAVPTGGLVQGKDGNLYGTTSKGGIGGQGTVFQISTNGLLTTLFWFDGTNGANPQSTLIQGSDGLFYGTAEFGGPQYDGFPQTGDGLVFRLTFDSLVITPSVGFTGSGPIGGPFSPDTETIVLTNTSSSPLTWSAANLPGNWLAANPTNGVLAPHTAVSVAVSLSAAAEILDAGVFTTSLVFTNWTTHVAQSEWFGLQIGQSIVMNGGFETGSFADWTLVGDTVNGGTVYNEVTTGINIAHSGTYGAELGDTILATLSQTLPTVSGQDYLLSFWLNNRGSVSSEQFLVKWNGLILYNVVNPLAFNWTNLRFIVTAKGASAMLQFGAQNGSSFFDLDDINVTPIPNLAFQSANQGSNGFNLGWVTTDGLTYRVQYKTDLLQPQWVNLGTPIVATGSPLTISDTNGVQSSSQRFYRLVVSP